MNARPFEKLCAKNAEAQVPTRARFKLRIEFRVACKSRRRAFPGPAESDATAIYNRCLIIPGLLAPKMRPSLVVALSASRALEYFNSATLAQRKTARKKYPPPSLFMCDATRDAWRGDDKVARGCVLFFQLYPHIQSVRGRFVWRAAAAWGPMHRR